MGCLVGSVWAQGGEELRVGLTPVFLDNQTAFLNQWRSHLGRRLQRPVEFVKRATYIEIVDLLRQSKLDFAWLCGYPYIAHRDELTLVATPVHQGRPLYRSYLIAQAGLHEGQSITDLRQRIFVYSDPNSNSGYLVPQAELHARGFAPQAFFRRTFFAWSHRGVVEAVASGLADAGAVDGYVYEALARQQPALVQKTRVLSRSEWFGFPPFVAHTRVAPAVVAQFRQVLLDMASDDEGRRLLQQLDLDGFGVPQEGDYDSIAHMVQVLREAGHVP